ncbi:hypothetical protein GCM10017772_48580 [Promicromonospora soli]|uniref:Uncharacterized protein n=1 Tax=Promicromonospora soli TaxID=2035533 RepID=A0A919GAH5_9MICO|nr:hypothetical protein GCM10017772_48580 [Promicromonospora soli]
MRLDHLLSKELISIRPHIVGVAGCLFGAGLVLVAEATHGPHVLVVVAHGWNIDEELLVQRTRPVRPLGGWNAEVVVGVVRRAHCWVLRQPAEGSSHDVLLRVVPLVGAGVVRWVGWS